MTIDLTAMFGKKLARKRFEQQVEAHLPMMVRIARGVVDQQSEAEDLVHDTCVKALAYKKFETLVDESHLKAWLNRILINTYRALYRRSNRSPVKSNYTAKYPNNDHATSEDTQNIVELVPSKELSPLESIQNRDSSEAIQQAFWALPPEVRVVSVLFLVNGLSYKDIASIADCPIGTVMSRLSRGRKILKERLSPFWSIEESEDIRNSSGVMSDE
jgi:RNA polymerase sigma-70 factor (ECF subfamily)